MGVEIKQLTIKSMLTSGPAEYKGKAGSPSEVDVDHIKEQILGACREQVEQMLSDSRER